MTAIFSVWFRYVVLLAARAVGSTCRLLFGAWHRTLLTLGAGGVLLLSVDKPPEWFPVSRDNVDAVAVALAVVALVRWVWLARRRLIIANFVDYTGAEPKAAPGVSTLLQVELARLYDLIRLVDDERAVPEAMKGPQNASFAEDKNLEEAEEDRSQITNERLDLPAPIRAEDVTNVLDAAVSIEAGMTVGPVRIPIGALASLLGRVAQGPRLVGSIHRTGGQLVVSARTVGDKVGHTWRVDRDLTLDDAGEPNVRPEDLLDELAVRILTDLALQGSARWQATWAYVDGLRAYRESLRAKKDRRLNLERAKDCLLRTVAEDDRFDLAHYNLGVVATDMQQLDAAEAAFLAAIERNPARWEPYYGLAQLYFVQARYPEMLPLCGRMIRLREHRAESFHLRALANRRSSNVPEAMADRRAAVRWAWFRLCWAALKVEESKAASVAGTSLRNLAVIRAYRAKEEARKANRQHVPAGRDGTEDDDDADKPGIRLRVAYMAAGWELRQGMFLHASDAELHFELGKIYAARRKWRAAIHQFDRAVEIVPDRPRFWVQLARACAGPLCEAQAGATQNGAAQDGVPNDALRRRRLSRARVLHRYAQSRRAQRLEALGRKALAASERAFEQPSALVDSGFDRLANVYTTLRKSPTGGALVRVHRRRVRQVRQLRAFETERRRWELQPPDAGALEERLRDLDSESLWQLAQVSLELCRRYLNPPADGGTVSLDAAYRAATDLGPRLEELRRHHPREVKNQDAHAVVAQVLHAAGDGDALAYAEAAVRHNPLSYEARGALADVQLSRHQLAEAEETWRRALVLEPERPYPNFRLGECLVRSALDCHSPDRRRRMLDEATRHFSTARALCDLASASDGEGGGRAMASVRKGQVAYWLGRAHFELDQYDQALTHLRQAVHLEYQTPLARLRMGVAYQRMGHFCEAEREFETTLHPAGGLLAADATVVGPPGDQLTPRAVEVLARIYKAGSHIERDAGVKEAIGEIEDVRAAIQELPEGDRPGFRALGANWEGWGWFRLGEVEKAVQCLTTSVELEPSAEAYLHLALVHAQRAGYARAAEQRRRDEERARHFADLAGRIGLGIRQRKPLDEMLRRLDAEREARAERRSRARRPEAEPAR